MNALVFLYKHVLKQPLDQEINAVRASRKINIPVVMTREEVAQVIALMIVSESSFRPQCYQQGYQGGCT